MGRGSSRGAAPRPTCSTRSRPRNPVTSSSSAAASAWLRRDARRAGGWRRGFLAGVRRGDKVALLMGNRPEWLRIDFASRCSAPPLVPISTWSRARELGYVLGHCDATTVITIARFAGQTIWACWPSWAPAPRDCRSSRAWSSSTASGRPADALRHALGARAAVGDAELDAAQRAVAPDDVAYILYTSGTTLDSEGRSAPARRPRREHVEHRRTPASDTGGPHVDGDLALLSFGCANAPWR